MTLNKLLIHSLVSLLLIGCTEGNKSKKDFKISKTTTLLNNEYLIKGQSFNKNYKTVYLFKVSNDSLISMDTSTVVNNRFDFKGVLENPAYFTVKTNANTTSYEFLVDASKIDMFLHDNLRYSSTYSNSDIQKKYKEYTSRISGFKNKGIELYYNLKGDFSKANIDKLKQHRANLFKEQSDYIADFISNNPESNFSAMLLKDNLKYFPSSKLRSLFNGLSSNIKEQAFAKSINTSISQLETADKAKKLYIPKAKTPLPNPVKGTEYRPNAYAFSGFNPDGDRMSLATIPQGKVVLLDFWASWCGPCRVDSPNLVKLYNKYKDKGLIVMSISEDKGEGEWISAIYADNLSWDYHVLDKNESIAFRYGVESIPHKILIDKQGRIASDKISGRALDRRIQQLLAE